MEGEIDRIFSVHSHQDCVLVNHTGLCDSAAADERIPQIRKAMQAVYRSSGQLAVIHSLLGAQEIDYPSRAKYVSLALEFAAQRPLWIVVVKNPAFRIIVRVAGLAAGQNMAVASNVATAADLARKQGFHPDPVWE